MGIDRVADANNAKLALFVSRKRAWLALLLYTAGLYSSLNLTYNLYVSVFDRIGRHRMSLLVNSFYAVVAVALALVLARRLPRSIGRYSAFLAILVAAGLLLNMEPVPADRIHLIQYAPLACLAYEVHRFRWEGLRCHAAALGTVVLVGCGDELLQSLLPSRHFDPHDVLLNTMAGILVLAFIGFVLPHRKPTSA